jgi:hypothetical protein
MGETLPLEQSPRGIGYIILLLFVIFINLFAATAAVFMWAQCDFTAAPVALVSNSA